MTEDEAKTKWCPFVRNSGAGGGEAGTEWHTNRSSFADVGTTGFDLCIASACMAWRWLDKREMRWTGLSNPPEGEGWERVENLNGPSYWLRYEQTPRGRCGLASQ